MPFDAPSPADAPPDPGLLADALEALEGGRLPSDFAIEEVAHLLAGMPRVAAELRRRRAVRRVQELLARGEYGSVRAVAPRVAREVGASAESVRRWASEVAASMCARGESQAGGIDPRCG